MPRRKRYLDNAAPADNTANVVRPINRAIQVKRQDTPTRRQSEINKSRQGKIYHERLGWINPNTRQTKVTKYKEKTALDKAAGRLYEAGERMEQAERNKEEGMMALEGLFKPIMPSSYIDMAAAIKNGQANNLVDVLAAPYLNDRWSARNPGKALAFDVLAPAVMGKAGIIGRNIANRNLFSYAYLEPYGYDNAIKRGGNILKHIITDNKLPAIDAAKINPRYYTMQRITGGYRDEAFRKYLGLPERTPLYVQNNDGTFSYNLNYLSRGDKSVVVPKSEYGLSGTGTATDMLTGNGGNVYVQYDDAAKIASVYDVWDINPFSRIPTPDIGVPFRNAADKLYRGLFPLYNSGKPWGRFGYNYLGGKQLNRFRYSSTPERITKIVDNALKPIRRFDASKLLGGKNFTLKQDIPYKTLTYEDVREMPLDYINLGSFYIGQPNFVDFSRVGSNGLIMK